MSSQGKIARGFAALGVVLLGCGIGGVWSKTAPAREETRVMPKISRERLWIVLPDSIRPYESPSLDAVRGDRALGYPDTLQESRRVDSESAQGGDRDWIEFEATGTRFFLPVSQLARSVSLTAERGNLPMGREGVDMETPLPFAYCPDDLVVLPEKWVFAKDGVVRLRAEAARAAEKMFEAARQEKIHLRAVSGYRSAEMQRRIYLRKIEKDGTDQQVVAKPGYSEHQLGTALDVSGLDPKTVLTASFGDTPEGRWLQRNAALYGFRFSYTEENASRTGYAPEPWHLRYMGFSQGKIRP